MDRKEYVLAVLAAGGPGNYTPAQLQKLFFILDRRIGDRIGGPRFDFVPYHYGPFDPAVYGEVRSLAVAGKAEITPLGDGRWCVYRPSEQGLAEGREILADLPEDVRSYFKQVADWVRKVPFQTLISTIYRVFPEMKVNSVFKEAQ